MARILKRSFGVIPFVANTTQSLDLPRNHVFKSIYARLTLSYTKVGGTALGVLNTEQPQSLVRSLAVVRNGSDVIQRADGGTYYALARVNSDGDPQRVALATNNAVGATALSVDIPIDFASWRWQNPGSTFLRAVGTSSLRLDCTWGDVTSIISGSDGAPAISSVQIEVFTEEIMDITGDFGDKLITIIERPIVVASNQFTIDLATGPFYRRLFLKTFDATLLSDVIVNRVRVISDGTFFHTDRMSWAAVQGMNKRNYALPTLLAGYAVIDFAEDGNPAGLIDTSGASQFQLELDVSLGVGATKVQVIQEQIVPARVAAAA